MRKIALVILVGTFEFSPSSLAFSERCSRWLNGTGAKPGSKNCMIRCGTAPAGMGDFDCNVLCEEFCGSERPSSPCEKLRDYVRSHKANSNQCNLFVEGIEEAIRQSEGNPDQFEKTMENLKDVFIGDDLTDNRSKGPCFSGQLLGATGFRENLRDRGNQVQHAMAGVWIGYKYGSVGCALAKWRESEPQDDRLYDATCPLGSNLNSQNYGDLAASVRTEICETSIEKGAPLK